MQQWRENASGIVKSIFFAHLVSRKTLKVFFYVGNIPNSRVGGGCQKTQEIYRISSVQYFRSNTFNKHHLLNDLISQLGTSM